MSAKKNENKPQPSQIMNSESKIEQQESIGLIQLTSKVDEKKTDALYKQIQTRKQMLLPFNTNNTLLYYQGLKKPVYYLSAYVRAKVISISGISYQEMSANLNCQFFIDISYRGLKQQQKNQMLLQGIRISFQTDQSVLLSKDNADVSIYDYETQKRVQYVIRKFVQTRISCEKLRLSPFEVIKCHIGLKINKMKIKSKIQKKQQQLKEQNEQQNQNQEDYILKQIHFNLMDHKDQLMKISTSIDCDFGIFQIASKRLKATYANSFSILQQDNLPIIQQVDEDPAQKKKKKKKKNKKNVKKVSAQDNFEQIPLVARQYGQQKLNQYNVALFQVPLFKKPVVANLTIFLPLFVLAVTNLGIFYQQPDLKDRIASISATMVSFVALIPTIRQQIPPTPKVTLVQFLVFIQSATTILALGDSLISRYQTQQNWRYNGWSNALFVISFVLTVLVFLTIFILSIMYIVVWRPSYIDLNALIAAGINKTEQINIFDWQNKQCDKYFQMYYQLNLIQIIEDVSFNNEMLFNNIFRVGLSSDQMEMKKIKDQL